jgi:hypothetical protein
MNNNKYLEQRKNRKKQWYRIRLGVLQFIHKPILNIFGILVIVASFLLVTGKGKAMKYFDIPEVLFPVLNFCMNFMIIFLPIMFALVLFRVIGELTARRDEANLMMAFDSKELRNGCPILMNKKKIKGTSVIIREFHTYIPYNTWFDKKNAIADVMNVHFVEEIEYGGKANGNRIVIKTARGRKSIKRDGLYDDEY